MENTHTQGNTMYAWLRDLFPICRSLTGTGVRQTLQYLQGLLPELHIQQISSGTTVFDWTVPNEWNIYDAYIADETGKRWIDFKINNLHVIGYSHAVDVWLSRSELEPHLHSLPEQPTAIPYITSYYSHTWGFCLSQEQRNELPDGPFQVVIDSTLEPGILNYADLVIPGESTEEILLSTYICHPSMANNELSGPVVACSLAQWLYSLNHRKYTYRFVFIPETIGAIVYINQHLTHLKQHVKAGYILTCLGDERAYSFLPSRSDNTLSDRVAKAVLKELAPDFRSYSYLERGSDERQYCSPGVDLPIASVMRSKYACYPEYHTSLDNLELVTATGLQGGFEALQRCLTVIENNVYFRITTIGEPQLGKRGLYPSLSTRETQADVADMMNILAYADGTRDLVALADVSHVSIYKCLDWCTQFIALGLMTSTRA